MPRLQAPNPALDSGESKTLLEGVARKLGVVPNVIRTTAALRGGVEGAERGASGLVRRRETSALGFPIAEHELSPRG